jgi:hypothetical protein
LLISSTQYYNQFADNHMGENPYFAIKSAVFLLRLLLPDGPSPGREIFIGPFVKIMILFSLFRRQSKDLFLGRGPGLKITGNPQIFTPNPDQPEPRFG